MRLLGKIAIALLTAICASAQITSPTVIDRTDSSARVQVSVTAASLCASPRLTWIAAGVVSGTYTIESPRWSGYGADATRTARITGLGSQAYWARVRAFASDCTTVVSSPEFIIEPTPQGDNEPIAPTVVDTDYPTITGSTFPVASNCSDLSAQLAAAAAASGAQNHEVVIPAGATCVIDGLVIPSKSSSNWIVVRSGGIGTVACPPAGVRLTSDARWSNCTATFLHRREGPFVQSGLTSPGAGTRGWRFAGIRFASDDIHYRTYSVTTIVDDPAASGCYKTTFATAPGSDNVLGSYGLLESTGITAATTPLVLAYMDNATTGRWCPLASGTPVPLVGTGSGTIRVYQGLQITAATAASPIAITTAQPHGLVTGMKVSIWSSAGLTGINGQHVVTVTGASTLTLNGSTGSGTYTGSGVLAYGGALRIADLQLDDDDQDITFDRCGFVQPPNVRQAYGVLTRGRRIAVIDGYASGRSNWLFSASSTDPLVFGRGIFATEATFVDATGFGPVRIENNEVEAGGIIFFLGSTAQNNSVSTTPSADLTLRRNTVTMPGKYFLTGPASNGLEYRNRHHLECKACERVAITGNRFSGGFANGGQPNGAQFMFSPRCSVSGAIPSCTESNGRIRDVRFAFNTATNIPSGMTILGGEQDWFDTPTTDRFVVEHNQFSELNFFANRIVAQAGNGGHFFVVTGGSRASIRNNLLWNNRGNQPSLFQFFYWRGARLEVTRNVIAIPSCGSSNCPFLSDTAVFGLPAADTSSVTARWSTFWPRSIFRDNTIVPTVENSANDADYASSSAGATWTDSEASTVFGSLASGNTFVAGASADARFTAMSFRDLAGGDFRPLPGATWAAAGHGPDWVRLDAEQGKVEGPSVRAISSSGATVQWLAPDSTACSLDYRTGAGAWTRTAAAGGARAQSVALTGLASGTTYEFRVLCAVEQPSGSFTTL